MTLADDEATQRGLERERELEAAKPLPEKALEDVEQAASGHDVLIVGATFVTALAIIVAILMALTHCGPAVHPATGPGSDYPCGLQGLSCGEHMCCWRSDVCGGGDFNGCPAGMCCAEGGNDLGVSAKRPYAQMLDVDVVSGRITR